MIDYKNFQILFNKISGEPEFEIYFKNLNDTYMIVKYNDCVTFQKCFDKQNRGEVKYKTLDELYNSNLIDKVSLKNDWNNIEDIVIDTTYSILNDKNEIKRVYGVNLK